MNKIDFKDPLVIFLLIIAGVILFARIIPMFFSIAANIFWLLAFAAICLFIYPPTRGIITRFFKRLFVK